MIIRPAILGATVALHPKMFCKLLVHFHHPSVENGFTISIYRKLRHMSFHKTMKRTRMLTPNPWQEIGGRGFSEEEEELTKCRS